MSLTGGQHRKQDTGKSRGLQGGQQHATQRNHAPRPDKDQCCAKPGRNAQELEWVSLGIFAEKGPGQIHCATCRMVMPPDPYRLFDDTQSSVRNWTGLIGIVAAIVARVFSIPMVSVHVFDNGLAAACQTLLGTGFCDGGHVRTLLAEMIAQATMRNARASLSSCALSSGKCSLLSGLLAAMIAITISISATPGTATSTQ